MTNLNVGVFGAAGKMGSTVCQAINNDDSTNLTFAVDTNGVGTAGVTTSHKAFKNNKQTFKVYSK